MSKPINSAIDAVGNVVGSAVSAVGTAATHAIAPLTSSLTRAVTLPGQGGGAQSPNITIDPTVSNPAQLPKSKPSGRGNQSSFLSGVTGGAAASGLSGGGFGGGGKSLLGQ